MKKYTILKIGLIIISICFVFLLGYNSIVTLSNTKYLIGEHVIVKPKKLNLEENEITNELKINDSKVIESSIVISNNSFNESIGIAKRYSFYEDKFSIISEVNEEKYYKVEKELKHNDNNKITYMSTQLYKMDDNKTFVISAEYNSIDDMKQKDKILEKIVKSIK